MELKNEKIFGVQYFGCDGLNVEHIRSFPFFVPYDIYMQNDVFNGF